MAGADARGKADRMTIQERLRPGKYRLRVEDYQQLDEAGVFGDARTELLDGEIIVMNAEYRPHSWVQDELAYRLRRQLEELGSKLYVSSASVRISDHSMPLPDTVLTDQPRGEGAIPPASVALLLEVSSTTLKRDLGRKLTIYARAGIPEYWVADVGARVIHQMWGPADGTYTRREAISFGRSITSVIIAGLTIATDEL